MSKNIIGDYMNSIFLTFDIDWAHDDIIADTLDILESENVKATIFVTHDTHMLKRIRSNPNIELGIHPDFVKSLEGYDNRHYKEIIDRITEIVPEAISSRSHALVQSSHISIELHNRGIIFDLNNYVPLQPNITRRPYQSPFGQIVVPYFFEDDIYFFYKESEPPEYFTHNPDGIKVFNFHPIHVYLNTESLERYETTKAVSQDTAKLKSLINKESYGTRDFLLEVVKYGKESGFVFKKINQVPLMP